MFDTTSVALAQHDNSVYRVGIVRFEDAAIMTVREVSTGRIRAQFTLPLEALTQIAELAPESVR